MGVLIDRPGDITEQLQAAIGKVIEIGEGEFRIMRPIVIPPGTKPTDIIGRSPTATRIQAQGGGFNARSALNMERLTLWRADWPIEQPAIGIFAEAIVLLEKMVIEGFTTGVYIWASHTDRGSNANGWGLRDLTVKGSGHAGIVVRGRDANGGKADRVRVYTSCEHAELWEKRELERYLAEKQAAKDAGTPEPIFTPFLGWAAGVVDKSFFGCTWDALLISSSADRDAGEGTAELLPYPPMILLGDSQHSVVDGMYRERDQKASTFSQGTIICGGLAGEWSGTGLRIDGPNINRLRILNAKDPANVTELFLGDFARAGAWFGLTAKALGKQLTFESDAKRQLYMARIAGQLQVAVIGLDGSVHFVKPPAP